MINEQHYINASLIEELSAISTALFSSYDLEELLDLILSKSREITCSDAGSIYLIDRNGPVPYLLFMAAQNDTKPTLSLQQFAMPLRDTSLTGYVALTGQSLNWADVYDLPSDVPYKFDRKFDQDMSYRTRSVLLIPMKNQMGEITGVVQLINRKVKPDLTITPENIMEVSQPYSDLEQRIVSLVASQAAIAIERNQLERNLANLSNDLQTRETVIPRYVHGIVIKQNAIRSAYLATNLLEGKTRNLISDQGIWTIGRARESAIFTHDKRLSRYHAAIHFVADEGFYLVDLDSNNGSFVNNKQIKSRHLLQDRDRVQVGGVTFTFFVCYSDRAVASVPSEVRFFFKKYLC